jgi:putative nucleotidyltransferase with HDIG domain
MSKQQILFVDDEPMVLQGLQRTLRPQRGEWNMVFVESGAQALEHMAVQPVDVIVSDMLMPMMNGAELLKEVVRRHPATVRMVLSGHADKELVSQCVGVAHQFISKPCDPEYLKALVKNACQLAGGLMDVEVKQVIGTIDRLPSAPEVYLDLREALARPEVDARRLGAIIQRDPGMTAKTRKLVNSAFFGMRKVVADPQEAVAYLGVEIVRTLVLSNGIFEASSPLPTRIFNVAEVWRHSLAVARVARTIAQLEGLSPAHQREAYAGGLLHDVGVLILASSFPDLYDQVAETVQARTEPLMAAEAWVFGVSHAEVGAYLLGLWGLPAHLLEIVSLHHQPLAIAGEAFSPALAVHVADVICGGAAGDSVLFGAAEFDPVLLRRPWIRARLEAWRAASVAVLEQGNP